MLSRRGSSASEYCLYLSHVVQLIDDFNSGALVYLATTGKLTRGPALFALFDPRAQSRSGSQP